MINYLRKGKFSTLTQYQVRGVFKQQLNEGETYSNFKVDDFHKSRDFQTLCYRMHHTTTNTTYVHFATNSITNQAALVFKTPPIDNSGIPHIVQQMLTCGSQKYPVRDAWAHMRGRSLQPQDLVPYIGTDHTVFQIQSALFDDLKQLFHLTFEQVFRPMFREVDFLSQVRIQHQGGNQMILRGNVYEQMIKQFEQPEFIHAEAVRKHLLKGTIYEQTTGGVPINMSEATYDRCQQYYQDYIHLSNAFIITIGDLDVLQYCQFLDGLITSYQNTIKQVKQYSLIPQKEIEPRLQLKGIPSFSFAFRGANLTECPDEYFKLGVLSFLLHDIQNYGLRPILEQYGQYCLNFGADITLHNQILQFGFNNKDCEQDLYNFISQLNDNVYSVIPKNIIEIALDRIKLRRTINISDIIPYIIYNVKPSIFLNQECNVDEFQTLVNKYLSQNKCTINMIADHYYIEDMNTDIQKHLKQLQVDYAKLAEQQRLIDEDTEVLSLESLPKINAANIIPLIKQKKSIKLKLNFDVNAEIFASKHPQQCNVKWIIDISEFNERDYKSICILKDLLPEFFNKKVSAHDVECDVVDDKFIVELICLDKAIEAAFYQLQTITDPELDNLELISESLSLISANYLSNENIAQIAVSYCQQEKYPIVQRARKICALEVEVLRNYTAKTVLQQLSQQLIECFYKIMNKNLHSFQIYTNPLLKDKIQSQLNLMLTNLKLQFDDYLLNKIEFNQKYELQGYKSDFKYLKTYVTLQTQCNYVTETIQIEHKAANYILANLLTHNFLPQYCTEQQQAACQYNNEKISLYTTNDVHTLRSYRIFENALHLLLECIDQDHLNSAKLASFQIDDPEMMQQILAVSEEDVRNQAQAVLKKMADGETAQVIFGRQIEQLDEFVKRGWTVERYINEVAV